MSNFFELHTEYRIGYKHLTDADLGRSERSHQTHIGLFSDVLTFLPNEKETRDNSIFIYNDECELLSVTIGKITRKNGKQDAPNIKSGDSSELSIVPIIRNICKTYSGDWYLFWFALKSEQIVFFLFNDKSKTFDEISKLGISLRKKVKGRLTPDNESFSLLVSYLENIINTKGVHILEDLEIISQNPELVDIDERKKIKQFDIEKANTYFKDVGKQGECLINKWLSIQKNTHKICNYTWFNKDKECGYPYDFTIEELDGNLIYLDVKTTKYTFEQKIIFSSQELSFINSNSNDYHIYRVYNLNENNMCFKICKNGIEYLKNINNEIINFIDKLNNYDASLQTAKIALKPSCRYFDFEEEIICNEHF